jgi:hypothetical protein
MVLSVLSEKYCWFGTTKQNQMLHAKNVLARQVRSIIQHKHKSVLSTDSTFDFLVLMISEK